MRWLREEVAVSRRRLRALLAWLGISVPVIDEEAARAWLEDVCR